MSHEGREKAMGFLGNTGELVREPVVADIYPSTVDPAIWIVWAVDTDGAMLETIFAGPSAEQRATEYAQAKFAGLDRRPPRPRQYE